MVDKRLFPSYIPPPPRQKRGFSPPHRKALPRQHPNPHWPNIGVSKGISWPLTSGVPPPHTHTHSHPSPMAAATRHLVLCVAVNNDTESHPTLCHISCSCLSPWIPKACTFTPQNPPTITFFHLFHKPFLISLMSDRLYFCSSLITKISPENILTLESI